MKTVPANEKTQQTPHRKTSMLNLQQIPLKLKPTCLLQLTYSLFQAMLFDFLIRSLFEAMPFDFLISLQYKSSYYLLICFHHWALLHNIELVHA